MDREWKVSEEQVQHSSIHDLIVSLDFPLIYTTNYDRNLEVAFGLHGRSFAKIANARDIALADSQSTQIVKFHGDFDDDESLVLTESDYFSRLSFDSPLDVKFRSDAMSRTVIISDMTAPLVDPDRPTLAHRCRRGAVTSSMPIRCISFRSASATGRCL
nr:SIR2 family protein [Falsirhodobacter deserti]